MTRDDLVTRLRQAAAQTLFENHPEVYPGAVSDLLHEAADALERARDLLREAAALMAPAEADPGT